MSKLPTGRNYAGIVLSQPGVLTTILIDIAVKSGAARNMEAR